METTPKKRIFKNQTVCKNEFALKKYNVTWETLKVWILPIESKLIRAFTKGKVLTPVDQFQIIEYLGEID